MLSLLAPPCGPAAIGARNSGILHVALAWWEAVVYLR
jgi:hypothetical protein